MIAAVKRYLSDVLHRARHGQDSWDIAVDGAGLAVRRNGHLVRSIEWSEVAAIIAWRKDLVTHAPVCVRFESRSDREPVVVDEFMGGFEKLTAELPHRFPSLLRDWKRRVEGTDAFAANPTQLWSGD